MIIYKSCIVDFGYNDTVCDNLVTPNKTYEDQNTEVQNEVIYRFRFNNLLSLHLSNTQSINLWRYILPNWKHRKTNCFQPNYRPQFNSIIFSNYYFLPKDGPDPLREFESLPVVGPWIGFYTYTPKLMGSVLLRVYGQWSAASMSSLIPRSLGSINFIWGVTG